MTEIFYLATEAINSSQPIGTEPGSEASCSEEILTSFVVDTKAAQLNNNWYNEQQQRDLSGPSGGAAGNEGFVAAADASIVVFWESIVSFVASIAVLVASIITFQESIVSFGAFIAVLAASTITFQESSLIRGVYSRTRSIYNRISGVYRLIHGVYSRMRGIYNSISRVYSIIAFEESTVSSVALISWSRYSHSWRL